MLKSDLVYQNKIKDLPNHPKPPNLFAKIYTEVSFAFLLSLSSKKVSRSQGLKFTKFRKLEEKYN